MSNRLTKIYTRTGDTGDTGLADGSRVSKDDVLMQVQGEVDELNSLLGVLLSKLSHEPFMEIVITVQNDLFDFGAEISLSQASFCRISIKRDNIDWLESNIDELNEDLLPLKEFILPGGGEVAALCHLARSVCRRVERNLVTLNKIKSVNSYLLVYINRLSDLLFVLARSIAREKGEPEVYWESVRLKNDLSRDK
jgi:cob(I)alamin adenosyltransferase